MSAVAIGPLLAIAGVLAMSSIAKAINPKPAIAMLTELGVPPSLTTIALAGAASLEGAVAVAVIFRPHLLAVQVTCASLFAVFASAGVFALGTGRVVRCGCFGALRQSTLGITNVLEFAIVSPIVFVAGRYAPTWGDQVNGWLLMVDLTFIALALLLRLAPDWRQVRGDRSSLANVQRYLRGSGARLSRQTRVAMGAD